MLGFLSYYAAKRQNISPVKAMLEHWIVATIVVILTHFGGRFIEVIFRGYNI
jgi:VIT1/CCC1 family predicted Fe2+/Mn2+ transporter